MKESIKVGVRDRDGSEVIKINRKTFVIRLSEKWLRYADVSTFGKNFFIQDNQWCVKLPLLPQYTSRFNNVLSAK